MERISHKVGDTVTLQITIDNLSSNYTDAKLSLFRRNTNNGFTGLIKELTPAKLMNDNTFVFIYNTDDFLTCRTTYYGHFKVNNNGIILNNYYKIRAIY